MEIIKVEQSLGNEMECSCIKIRPSSRLKIPKEFKDIILDIEPKICDFLGNNLLLYSVVGSCAFETCISDWSDIDILVIVDHIDDKILNFITYIAKQYKIHVGISIFSVKQLILKELDLKTRFYFYFIQQGRIIPSKVSKKLEFPRIDLNTLKRDQIVHRNELLFSLERKLYDDKSSSKDLFKLVVNILKIELSLNNVVCATINEVWENANNVLQIDVKNYIPLSSIPVINRTNLKKLGKELLWKITI